MCDRCCGCVGRGRSGLGCGGASNRGACDKWDTVASDSVVGAEVCGLKRQRIGVAEAGLYNSITAVAASLVIGKWADQVVGFAQCSVQGIVEVVDDSLSQIWRVEHQCMS